MPSFGPIWRQYIAAFVFGLSGNIRMNRAADAALAVAGDLRD
jgi:hypothetical protein